MDRLRFAKLLVNLFPIDLTSTLACELPWKQYCQKLPFGLKTFNNWTTLFPLNVILLVFWQNLIKPKRLTVPAFPKNLYNNTVIVNFLIEGFFFRFVNIVFYLSLSHGRKWAIVKGLFAYHLRSQHPVNPNIFVLWIHYKIMAIKSRGFASWQ